MGHIQNMWLQSVGRRKALVALAGMLGSAIVLRGQQDFSPSADEPLNDHQRARGIDEMMTAFDFEPVFKSNVPLSAFDYVAHASDSEWTKVRNREAFGWVDIIPRPSVDVSAVNLSTELFGVKLDNPFFVAPTGQQFRTHPEGTPAMRRGASDAKTILMVPSEPGFHESDRTRSQKAWDDTVKNGTYPFFWQYYPAPSLKDSREALEKMQTDGAKVIAVTCDMQSPYYPRDVEDDNLGGKPLAKKAKQDVPPPLRNARANWWYTWKYLDQLREIIKVPMIAKGIVTPEDAELCIQHGLEGIYVSNHGGRSLCYEPSTIEVLPEIMTAVRGRVPVIFDSGVYHGADAFKALALGAKMVGLGRAPRWGLGAYGAPGVTRLLEIMQKDLAATMAKYGQPTVASIDQTAVRTHFV